MQSKNTDKPKNFITGILKKLAPKIGATLLIEPEYEYTGMITFANGKKVFYRNTRFNINPLGSAEVAKDKYYTSFFLKEFGYKVPEGRSFFSEELNERIEIKRNIIDGFEYAQTIGLPVIIKPNNMSQGSMVTKIYQKKEYFKVAKKILKATRVMIVEKFYDGNDYRVVVLDGEIISAYQREPLKIVGDGKQTILELMQKVQQDFTKSGRDTIIDTEDYRINLRLKKYKMNYDTVLPENQLLQLLDNANLSTGGTSYDLTQTIHPDYANLAINVTRDMGLRLCGVDIITSDICKPLSPYTIIEINSAPGLDNYASMGREQEKNVEELYLKILKSLENS